MSWKLLKESNEPLSRYNDAAMSTTPALTAASGTVVRLSEYPACTLRLNDQAFDALTDDVMKAVSLAVAPLMPRNSVRSLTVIQVQV